MGTLRGSNTSISVCLLLNWDQNLKRLDFIHFEGGANRKSLISSVKISAPDKKG